MIIRFSTRFIPLVSSLEKWYGFFRGGCLMLSMVIVTTVVAGLAFSFYYSFKSRRMKDPVHVRFYQSKMNISIGVALVGLALNQFLFYDFSGIRLAIGIVFLLLGLFNFIMGIKNYRFYSSKG